MAAVIKSRTDAVKDVPRFRGQTAVVFRAQGNASHAALNAIEIDNQCGGRLGVQPLGRAMAAARPVSQLPDRVLYSIRY